VVLGIEVNMRDLSANQPPEDAEDVVLDEDERLLAV
jgi:hypothetical protein